MNKKVLLANQCAIKNLYYGNPGRNHHPPNTPHTTLSDFINTYRKADCKAKPLQHGQKTCTIYKREGVREREHVKVKETVTHSVSNREGDITLYTPSCTHKSRAHLSQFTLARRTLSTQGSTG